MIKTSIVSLFLPPNSNSIQKAQILLKDKFSSCKNIKAKANRESVQRSIEKVLKVTNNISEQQILPNGIIIYCGVFGDSQQISTIRINPVEKLNAFIYNCDADPHTDPLNQMLKNKQKILYILADGQGLKLWTHINGNEQKIVNLQYQVVRKHNKGGQSAPRFGRLAQQYKQSQITGSFQTIIDIINQETTKFDVVLLCGQSDVKTKIKQKLQDSFVSHIIPNIHEINISKGSIDIKELHELKSEIQNLSEIIGDSAMKQERLFMEQLLDKIRNGEDQFTCGTQYVIDNINHQNVSKLLINEDLQYNLNAQQIQQLPFKFEDDLIERNYVSLLEILVELKMTNQIQCEICVIQSEDVKNCLQSFGSIAAILYRAPIEEDINEDINDQYQNEQ